MRAKRILFDCDGVLADLIGSVCAGLGTLGFRFVPEDFTSYDMRNTLPESACNSAFRFMSEPGFVSNLRSYNGADRLIQVARTLGDVRCITAPWDSATWSHERKEWLSSRFFQKGEISSVPGAEKRFHYGDVLIEDRADTCEQWVSEWRKPAILIDRPWNRNAARVPHVYRATLQEAVTMLPELLEAA